MVKKIELNKNKDVVHPVKSSIAESNEHIITLKQALEKVSDTPDIKYLWSGIPHSASLTLFAARAKQGKTIFLESLALSLVDENSNEFLGLPIPTVDSVFLLSFEENIINRSKRQMKQLKAYLDLTQTDTKIDERIFVFNSTFHQFLADDKQRNELLEMLEKKKPSVLIIDSLGRLAIGQIEHSDFAQQLMLYLRSMAFKLDIPIIVVHHTVKSKKAEGVELSSMAGSRYLSQEACAVVTIVEGNNRGERIVRPLAFRYASEDVADISFRITDDCLVEQIPESERFSFTTKATKSKEDILKEYFETHCTATTTELEEFIKSQKVMGRSTMFEILRKLPVDKTGGVYKYRHCNSFNDNEEE